MPLPLLEAMSSRKRRPNWTDQECLLLAQLMQERREIIRGKCSTGVSIQEKRQAWEEITQAINATFPQMQRTVSDCNKKWENLLAKSREEIKRQKRQVGTDEGLLLQQFSAVTQIVISVMNLSDMLHLERGDMFVETDLSSETDEKKPTVDEKFTDKLSLSELELPSFASSQTLDPSASPPGHKLTPFPNVPRSLALHFNGPCTALSSTPAEQLDTPCSASPTSAHCSSLQERLDLEMSVLRRQEAVLKLQEEYYTLKIKLMKKQMEEPTGKD
ncbi:uncharacterized protein LOC143000497 [Genypterus blacodes]|uniref:uncharacterized protein LOC143000497 n=1 Tax=Genypterus blacodes TaxID=154954 RepID=UPI003F76B088